jgi:hypothetical protein
MAGYEVARNNLGCMDIERALKHWTIGASAGCFHSMYALRINFEKGCVRKELIDSTLTVYNSSCVKMRSKARDACIRFKTETN